MAEDNEWREIKYVSHMIAYILMFILILGLFYAGDPDLMDSIIKYLSKGC